MKYFLIIISTLAIFSGGYKKYSKFSTYSNYVSSDTTTSGGGETPAVWTPYDSNTEFIIRLDLDASVYHTSNNIDSIADLSGNGYTATQLTAGHRYVYYAAGDSMVGTNADDTHLDINKGSGINTIDSVHTIVVRCKFNDKDNACIISSIGSASYPLGMFGNIIYDGGANQIFFNILSDINIGQWHNFVIIRNAEVVNLYLDNVQKTPSGTLANVEVVSAKVIGGLYSGTTSNCDWAVQYVQIDNVARGSAWRDSTQSWLEDTF